MKALLLSTLLSTSAFAACPDLSGKYAACRSITGDSAGSTDMVVTQVLKNGVVTYTITATDNGTNERTTDTYRADGRSYTTTETMPDTDLKIVTTINVSCVGNTAVQRLVASAEGQEMANVVSTMAKVGKQLLNETVGTIFGSAIADKVICE